MGWFYRSNMHLVVTDQGELVSCCLTPGNVDDRKPVPQPPIKLWCKLVDDRGNSLAYGVLIPNSG